MLEAGWGRIVNISSSSTHSGTPMKSHYVAAKSAVNGLTKSLAQAKLQAKLCISSDQVFYVCPRHDSNVRPRD